MSDPATEAYDPIAGTIDWGDGNTTNITGRSISGSHSYAAGSYTITVSVNDGDLGTDSKTQAVSLLYNRTGFLQPINMDNSSNFKLGSTIPVKIKVTDCNGASVGTLVPQVFLTRVGSGSGTVNEPVIVERSRCRKRHALRLIGPSIHLQPVHEEERLRVSDQRATRSR